MLIFGKDIFDFVTGLAAVIAAVAAIFAAVNSWQQTRIMDKSTRHPKPVVSCSTGKLSRYPGWIEVLMSIRNVAQAQLYIESLRIKNPKGTKGINYSSQYVPMFVQGMREEPLPIEKAAVLIPVNSNIEPVGARVAEETFHLALNVPERPIKGIGFAVQKILGRSPFIELELTYRWGDSQDRQIKTQRVKIFATTDASAALS